jgi:L-fucose isomerase-like protein
MLSNLLDSIPVVCEVDICHAVMAKLGAVLSGEPSVILDFNNSGWDPRVFLVFHCSQTPPNWLVNGGEIDKGGGVAGKMAPVPFTGIAAATTSDRAEAVIFSGHFLREPTSRGGSSGWAFVPNFPSVLKTIESHGIHHFVAIKGDVGEETEAILSNRGFEVFNLCECTGNLEEIEKLVERQPK